eukprot:COSAG06_NODE_64915_length_258_cov_0.654088_2_plen_21_part_01
MDHGATTGGGLAQAGADGGDG